VPSAPADAALLPGCCLACALCVPPARFSPQADAAVQAYVDDVVGFALFEKWDLVWAAVEGGLNVNAQNSHGRTVLHWAAFKRHAATVRLVLDLGGDPNVRDDRGVTPVWRAAWSGTADIMRDLVAAGGDVNTQDFEGVPALVVLVCNREGDAVERLGVLLERPELDVLIECVPMRGV
jgi:hypothetical protein